MPGVAQRQRPDTRRLALALERIAAEAQELQLKGSSDAPDWKMSFVRGQRKVLDRYQEVLATHDLPHAERTSIEQRIGRIEAELAHVTAAPPADGTTSRGD